MDSVSKECLHVEMLLHLSANPCQHYNYNVPHYCNIDRVSFETIPLPTASIRLLLSLSLPQQDIAQWHNRAVAVWRQVGAGQGQRFRKELKNKRQEEGYDLPAQRKRDCVCLACLTYNCYINVCFPLRNRRWFPAEWPDWHELNTKVKIRQQMSVDRS